MRARLATEKRTLGLNYLTTEFIVQRFEPLFDSQQERRLYFSNGDFLYAVGHVGWIGSDTWPDAVPRDQLSEELEQAKLIFEDVPLLKTYWLLRLDFGPNAILNELEMLPDLFGGPALDLTGVEWEQVRQKIIGNMVKQMNSEIFRDYPDAEIKESNRHCVETHPIENTEIIKTSSPSKIEQNKLQNDTELTSNTNLQSSSHPKDENSSILLNQTTTESLVNQASKSSVALPSATTVSTKVATIPTPVSYSYSYPRVGNSGHVSGIVQERHDAEFIPRRTILNVTAPRVTASRNS